MPLFSPVCCDAPGATTDAGGMAARAFCRAPPSPDICRAITATPPQAWLSQLPDGNGCAICCAWRRQHDVIARRCKVSQSGPRSRRRLKLYGVTPGEWRRPGKQLVAGDPRGGRCRQRRKQNGRPVFDCDARRAGQNRRITSRTGGPDAFTQQQQQATPVLLAYEANHRWV